VRLFQPLQRSGPLTIISLRLNSFWIVWADGIVPRRAFSPGNFRAGFIPLASQKESKRIDSIAEAVLRNGEYFAGQPGL
jgi:hypothetical protein